MTFRTLLKQPGAFVPLAMSLAALAVLLVALGLWGIRANQQAQDEGTAAHLWQLLIGGQLPVVAWFALKWLPRAPKQALGVLLLQALAGASSCIPVFALGL
jgi:hypothetical protein